MCRGCILRGSNAAQSNLNMPTSVFLPVYTYSHLLWHHCSCLSPSYLIRHPLTPICNSNENKTPALPTFTPLCKSLHHNNKEKTEKGEVKKVWDRGSPYQKKILCYCWPARLDCQMAKHGKKKKWSLSLVVASTAIFSHSERVRVRCKLSACWGATGVGIISSWEVWFWGNPRLLCFFGYI